MRENAKDGGEVTWRRLILCTVDVRDGNALGRLPSMIERLN